MTKFIGNAFISLGMVKADDLGKIRFEPVPGPDADCVSIVGHADTAAALGVEFNRASVTLEPGDTLFVAQLQGGRLPEGCKTLPEGFSFTWVKVTLAPTS